MEHNASHTSSHKGLMLGAAVVLLVAGIIGGYFIGNSAGDDSTSSAGSTTVSSLASKASATEHNDADVTFASDMSTHHAQALSMVDLTLDRPLDPEVQALAEDIRAAQGPEIETMADWLTEWGEEVPATMRDHANAGHDMGDMSDTMDDMGHDDMPGMMTADDMDGLENASDAAPNTATSRAPLARARSSPARFGTSTG